MYYTKIMVDLYASDVCGVQLNYVNCHSTKVIWYNRKENFKKNKLDG